MDPIMLILIGGGSLAVILLVVGVVSSVTSERSLVEQRLGRYMADEARAAKKEMEKSTAVSDWVNERLEKSRMGGGMARELARADIKLRTAEYLVVVIFVGLLMSAFIWYIGGQNIIVAVIGFMVGILLPRMYVKRQQGKRLQHFNEQLADMLNLMVNGLRAGYSSMQAMEAVAREMPSPISDEFRRVVQEMQLGIAMEPALENLLRRIPSDDLDLVVAAMNVQREVGGNLAEVLDTISYTIRERVRIKGEVRVLTSQVVYSGRFLAMMPVFISVTLWFINRPYMMEFFNPETRVVGLIALGTGVFMIVLGYFVMTKIASIDV